MFVLHSSFLYYILLAVKSVYYTYHSVLYSTVSLITMSKKMCVRLKLFFKCTRMSYSTKNPKNTVHKKMTRPKNIFQGDLQGYYACDATMIKKEREKEKRALDKKSEGE